MTSASCPSAPTARSRVDRSRGQAIVEFALIFPIFLLLLLIAVDAGRLYFSLIQVHNAAREGAAVGAVSPTDLASITARARQETNAQAQRGEHAIAVAVACGSASGTSLACSRAPGGSGAGNTITVSVAERFTFLTPFINGFFDDNFSMGASATAGVLGYAAPGGGSAPGPCGGPHAAFTVNVTSGTTIFADPSASTPNSGVCNISGYTWQWGDGKDDVGSATGDAHTYVAAGSYTISLTVTNQAGPASTTRNVTVPAGPPPPTCAVPKASFTYVKSGKAYSFADTSTVADPVNCPVTNWAWDFGDGVLGNAQNPLHTYTNSKTHTVTLVASNAGGSSAIYSHAQ
jgi:PKD repeat protein